MSTNSQNSKRIAKNTIVLYFRMLFLMLVGLYTSRIILDALGVNDYGIYNVVGGFVSMFSLISAALTSACSRFLNFELGKGNIERQTVVFSTALTIQFSLAIIVAILSEIIGVWYINNVMVLPSERLEAANWCFQFSIFNFCMNLITVPYNASIIAHEKMKAFAYIGLFQGLAQLAIAFLIYWEPFDRLVYFAMLLMLLQFFIRSLYQFYCRRHFKECHYQFVFDKPLLTHMFSYSLWHLIGNGAAVLKNHGVNLVLNLFFGPAVNAARGVASQVDRAIGQFVSNFMIAMNPQITKSYAKGDYEYMHKLVNNGARFSFFLLLVLSLPVIINADYILHLWLKQVPPYAVTFSQLTLVAMMINSISKPLITAQNATGNVRNYQIIVGGIELLNLPLSYLCLYVGMQPTSVVFVAIFVSILALGARLYLLPFTLTGFIRMSFFKNVIITCLMVAAIAAIIPIGTYSLLPKNFAGFMINALVCLLLSAVTIYFIGCDHYERAYIISKIKDVYQKKLHK